jgi:hypothetical protein
MGGNDPNPEIVGLSIVARGSFNPAIFQPRWFSSNNLIRDEEADQATIEIIHTRAAIFSTEWFSLQVTDDRFSVETRDPTKVQPLRDLAIGTFKILEHTPIEAFGLNGHYHFRMKSESEWHAFGHHYAPKESWGTILDKPGMRSLTMEGKREDCIADHVRVKIEPSVQVHPGIYVHVNQHYRLEEDDGATPADLIARFVTTVQQDWDGFTAYCDSVSRHLLSSYST